MAWRVAKSLEKLREEVNALAPDRSKVSDGTIGDTRHQGRCSRHNPNDKGVVCALDLTHDPGGGFNAHKTAERIRQLAMEGKTNPNLEYIISNRRICSRSSRWVWLGYSGSNPHTRHVHFAVGRGTDCEAFPPYDDESDWRVEASLVPTSDGGMVDVKLPVLSHGDEGGGVTSLQSLLNSKAGQGLKEDGIFGDKTEQGVINVQRYFKIAVDGVVGRQTWPTLFL